MTNRFNKYSEQFEGNPGDHIEAADHGNTFEAGVPVGAVLAWHKTFFSLDSGTTSSTSAGHLVQSGQNFLTTCHVGNTVFNSTASTFAYITVVNSDTDLTLSADIITSGQNFTIYATPRLPDAWIECNGQAISNVLSPYDGGTAPSLNGTTDATRLFMRGIKSAVTGSTGGADTINLAHTHTGVTGTSGSTNTFASGGNSFMQNHSHTISSDLSATQANLPVYMDITWVMRIY